MTIMKKNLFQQMVFEVYQNKLQSGFKVIETENMFLVLWNDPQIAGLNVAHCNKFDKAELKFLQRHFKGIKINVTCDEPCCFSSPNLTFSGETVSMILATNQPLQAKTNFDIKLTQTKPDIDCFCQVVGDAFQMQPDVKKLAESLYVDEFTPKCRKYIGYIDGSPAGVIELSQGSAADLIAWVGVTPQFQNLGLSRALVAYVINQEISTGRTKFVLSAGAMSQKIYAKFGFKILAQRYNYELTL